MNKNKEREILEMVYSIGDLEDVIETERPDFKLRKIGQETYFGVEITTFYTSASDARLHNIPTYVKEIFENSKYRHKDDIARLELKDIVLKTNRKPDETIKGFMQEVPPLSYCTESVAQIISEKSDKVSAYTEGITHVNLVIFDNVYELYGFPIETFYHALFTTEITNALFASNFREIYFVTKAEHKKPVYFPLKMLLLVSEAYLFDRYYQELVGHQLPTNEKMLLFAKYLSTKTKESVGIVSNENGVEVVFGNAGIYVTTENEVMIRDNADYITHHNIISTSDDYTPFEQKRVEVLKKISFRQE